MDAICIQNTFSIIIISNKVYWKTNCHSNWNLGRPTFTALLNHFFIKISWVHFHGCHYQYNSSNARLLFKQTEIHYCLCKYFSDASCLNTMQDGHSCNYNILGGMFWCIWVRVTIIMITFLSWKMIILLTEKVYLWMQSPRNKPYYWF